MLRRTFPEMLHLDDPAASDQIRAMTSFVQASVAPSRKSGEIKLHGPEAFEGMRRAGRLAAEALDLLVDMIKPGVTTQAIDRFALDFALSNKAHPATLLYRGYRYSVCTSINHVVCHGMPNDKPLREGDIVNIDVTFDRSTAGMAIRAGCIRSAPSAGAPSACSR